MAKKVMTIYCGECGTGFRVDAALAGKQIRCTKCRARLPLPSAFSERPQIRLFCPNCGTKVRAWPDQGGEPMNCPNCGEEIRLPKIVETGKTRKGDTQNVGPEARMVGEAEEEDRPDLRLGETDDEEDKEDEEEEDEEDEDEVEIKPDKVLDRHADSKLPSFRKARARKIRFFCPSCGKRLERDPEDKGKRFRCPFCKEEVAPTAKAVRKVEEKPERTKMLVAHTTCEILGILLVFIGAALLGKSLAMGAWQELMGLDAGGARTMGMGMCVLGPMFLLIGGFANLRGFLAASLLIGALIGMAYAGLLGSQGATVDQLLQPIGIAVLMIAFAGLISAFGRKKASIRCRILGGVFPIFAAFIFYPGFTSANNERAAVEWMRRIGERQDTYKENVCSDQDKDEVGEYGLLCELVGEVVPRGSKTNKPVSMVYMKGTAEGDFNTKASKGEGIAEMSGYCYRIYVPGPDGSMNDRSHDGSRQKPPTKLDAKKHAKLIDLQEQCYVLYVWPKSAGRTGRRAYAMNQSKTIFYTDMKAEQYSGGKAPEARTAYVKDAVPDSFFNNAFGEGGETFGDNVWRPLGASEKKPGKAAPPVVASKTTGLVPGKPIPTPCAFQRMSRSPGQIFSSALIFPEENVMVTPVGQESLKLAAKGEMAGWPIAKGEFYWAPTKKDATSTVSWVEQKMTITPLTQADKDWLKALKEKSGAE